MVPLGEVANNFSTANAEEPINLSNQGKLVLKWFRKVESKPLLNQQASETRQSKQTADVTDSADCHTIDAALPAAEHGRSFTSPAGIKPVSQTPVLQTVAHGFFNRKFAITCAFSWFTHLLQNAQVTRLPPTALTRAARSCLIPSKKANRAEAKKHAGWATRN